MTKQRTSHQKEGHSTCAEQYVLRLYVSGATPQSTLAIMNVKKICDSHLRGRYALEVIDIYQEPDLAKRDQVIAVPTLIKRLPHPVRKLIGDMSNTERLLDGLGVRTSE
jgi:circadian clock protein KaiB